MSMNQTLPRTILTSVTTLLALLALFFFGGEVLRSFVAAMIFGVVIGTYSSIFIAAPILIMTLYQDTGQMEGRVLEGRFEDRLLSELTLDELKTLFDEIAPLDRQSAELLDTYADRLYGDAWRSSEDGPDDAAGGQRSGGGPGTGTMCASTSSARSCPPFRRRGWN